MTEARPADPRGAWIGVGLACGFAAWTVLVPWDDAGLHWGGGGPLEPIRAAARHAFGLWLTCALGGAALGLALRGAARRDAHLRELGRRVVAPAAALYALALRGVPGGGWLLPLAATLALAVLLFLADRKRRATGGRLALAHLCASLTAAHLAVQLPYYAGLARPFVAGLAALAGFGGR